PIVISGLQVHFDHSLANHLRLPNRFERPQCTTIHCGSKYIPDQNIVIVQEKETSKISGAAHLLRILVTLRKMITQPTLDAESTDIV
ncbi:hypothetical protein B0H14DRAFT_2254011, partial [Mycena olivaceomarginata]